MSRALALLLSVLALIALPATAGAQGTFEDNPLPPPPQAPTATPEPADDPFDDQVGVNTLYILGGALFVGFAVIGWWITRDARRSLPPEDRRPERLREEGPHRRGREAKAKSRAKGRAAKAARRRSRSKR